MSFFVYDILVHLVGKDECQEWENWQEKYSGSTVYQILSNDVSVLDSRVNYGVLSILALVSNISSWRTWGINRNLKK